MKRLSQSGSSNFCPELRKNALLISQSHFSNFALHVIMLVIKRTTISILEYSEISCYNVEYNLYMPCHNQACWQLAAVLLSSSLSKRCERILISAWWLQVKIVPAADLLQLARFWLCTEWHAQTLIRICSSLGHCSTHAFWKNEISYISCVFSLHLHISSENFSLW